MKSQYGFSFVTEDFVMKIHVTEFSDILYATGRHRIKKGSVQCTVYNVKIFYFGVGIIGMSNMVNCCPHFLGYNNL